MEERKCPHCGETYKSIPCTSREDNETLICPDCGMREALKPICASADEVEEIIATVHKYSKPGKEE